MNKRLEKLGLSPQNESTSLPELPIETPLLRKKHAELMLQENGMPKSVGNLETKSLNGKSRTDKSLTPSPNERDSFASDASEKKDEERSITTSTSMGSNSTLTNVSILFCWVFLWISNEHVWEIFRDAIHQLLIWPAEQLLAERTIRRKVKRKRTEKS